MKKATLTEDKAEKTPTGGVLVGKREGQTIIHNKGTLSGYLVGKTHAEGGIKAVNKSTGQPLEMQGGEVVITAPAVSDNTKNEFNGKMMTNREILSQINVKGGGVAFAKDGMEIPKNIRRTGASYNYGGKTMTDHEIYRHITKKQKQSLVRDAKSGNTPARDLNNYNDVLDIDADGMVGAETGLYADGGYIKNIKKLYEEDGSDVYGGDFGESGGLNWRINKKEDYLYLMGIGRNNKGSNEGKSKGEGSRAIAYLFFLYPKLNVIYFEIEGEEGAWQFYKKIGAEEEGGGEITEDTYNAQIERKSFRKYFKNKDISFSFNKGGLIAPNGNPSNLTPEQYKLVRTPEFKAWFGDWENDPENSSKVVDENGEPLVVYHGTTMGNFNNFKSYINFFAKDKKIAKNQYSTINSQGDFSNKSKVFEVFLNLKNPYKFDAKNKDYSELNYKFKGEVYDVLDDLAKEIKNNYNTKYDGLIVLNIDEEQMFGAFGEKAITDDFITFEPNQIKLADGSNTKFDGSNPDIRFATGGDVNKARYRIIDSNGKVKYTGGTEMGSWFTLEKAKELVNYSNGEMIYEYDYNGDRLYEVFATGGDVKPFDANMEGDSADIRFDKGGELIGVIKIGKDIYISKNINELPKDSLIVEHRYFKEIKAGDIGFFTGEIDDVDSSFGDKVVYVSIGKNVKIKTILNSYSYLEEKGILDVPNEYIIKKYGEYGINTYRQLSDEAYEYLNNPNDWYYEFQKKTLELLREDGEDFDVLEMLYEDESVPHQYLINKIDIENNDLKYNDGGDVKPYDANMEGDSADMMFVRGGGVKKTKTTPSQTSVPTSKVLTKDDLKYTKIWIGNDVNLKDKVVAKLIELDFPEDARYPNKKSNNLYIIIYDDDFVIYSANIIDFEKIIEKQIFPADLGINVGATPTSLPIDLLRKKIWVHNNPDLSRRVQELGFANGFENIAGKKVHKTNFDAIYFGLRGTDKYMYILDSTRMEFDNEEETEIFESDLFGTTTATPTSTPFDFTQTKIWIGNNPALSKKIQERAFQLGFDWWGGDKNVSNLNFDNLFFDINQKITSASGKANFNSFKDFKKITEADIFGTGTATPTSATFDLSNTKIWVENNPILSKKIQKKAFELGWSWRGGDTITKYENSQALYFLDNNTIAYSNNGKDWFNNEKEREIFESDLFPTSTSSQTSKQNAPVEDEDWVKKFTADLDKLVFAQGDLESFPQLSKEEKDLENLKKLLPSFQQKKYAIERAKILKEIKRLHNKLTYEGFIQGNEEGSTGADLFTPQGLLDYYFTQATQNPTAELDPPCELPTPNGEKSKLPMSAYLNVRTPQFKNWFGDWEKAYETGNYVNCSKMIDPDTKEPKIYFHGVRKYVPNFGQFSNMGQGVVRPYGAFEPTFPASYFAGEEDYAKFYGGVAENLPTPSADYKPFIYKVFLSVKNPISLLPLDFMLSYKDFLDYIYVSYGVKVTPNQQLLTVLENDMIKKNPMWIYIRRDIGVIELLKDYGYDAIFQMGDIPTFLPNGEVEPDRTKHLQEIEYLTFYPNQVKSATVKKSFYFDFFNDIRFKNGGYVRI